MHTTNIISSLYCCCQGCYHKVYASILSYPCMHKIVCNDLFTISASMAAFCLIMSGRLRHRKWMKRLTSALSMPNCTSIFKNTWAPFPMLFPPLWKQVAFHLNFTGAVHNQSTISNKLCHHLFHDLQFWLAINQYFWIFWNSMLSSCGERKK